MKNFWRTEGAAIAKRVMVSLALVGVFAFGLHLLGWNPLGSTLAAFPNLSDIIATTIENRSREIADNVSKNTALLAKLRKRKNIRPISGGSSIMEEISFQENGNFLFYSGYDLLNVAAQDVITSATYQYRQAACAVLISGLEKIQNNGKERMISLIDSRMEVAEQTIVNNLSGGAYSDGTGFGGKQVTGLAAAVPTDPTTGTYGGIDRALWPFWRPQVVAAAGYTSATIGGFMNTLWLKQVRNGEMPDLITADNLTFGAYLAYLQSLQRFTQADVGELGFPALKFMSCDVTLDGGIGGFAPANSMWFLNTKYAFFRPVKGRDIVPLSPDRRTPFNQDAEAQLMAWAGQFTLRNSFLQGFFKGF